jgi:AcrR family transcriptional regulator
MDPATLTMAAVAASLGVSTSALYRWVADREALLDLVSERAAVRMLPDWEPGADTWREWLTDWAHRTRRELGAVPGYAQRVLTGPHRAAGHSRVETAAVEAFRAAGATRERAQQYWYVFSTSVVGWITVEQAGRFPTEAALMDFTALLQVLLRGSETTIALDAPAAPRGRT